MKDRIKQIRKENKLTQKEFAERLGIKQNTVASYEMGRIRISDSVIISICREFNIREEWIRNGNLPMHNEKDWSFTELLSDLDDSDDEFIKSLIRVYMGLDKDSKNALRKIADVMAKEYKRRS